VKRPSGDLEILQSTAVWAIVGRITRLWTIRFTREVSDMQWKAPKVVEVCVGLEINSYASAEI